MENIALKVTCRVGEMNSEFTVFSGPVLDAYPNAWKVTRDSAFIGYIYKDSRGYHQTHSAVLLMPEIVDAIALEIERQIDEGHRDNSSRVDSQ